MSLAEPTPQERKESELRMWQAIGLSNRLQKLHAVMWDALVEGGKHVTVYANGELIGEERL